MIIHSYPLNKYGTLSGVCTIFKVFYISELSLTVIGDCREGDSREKYAFTMSHKVHILLYT